MPALTAYQLREELRSLPGLKIARSPIRPLNRRSSTPFWIKRLALEDDDDDDDDNLIKEIQAVEKAEKAKELKTDLLAMLALNQAAANAAPNAGQDQVGARPEGGAVGAGASATAPVSSVTGGSTAAAAASSTASSQESATATSSISTAEATQEGSKEPEGIITSGKKGLHPGAIAGIVIGSLLLVILVAVLIYRRTQVNKRLRKRSTWAIKPYDFDDAQGLAEKGMDAPRTTYAPSTSMEQTGTQPVSLAAMANPWNPEPMTSSTGTPFVLAKPPPGGKHSKKKSTSQSRGSTGSVQTIKNSDGNGSHSRTGSVSDPLALPPSLIVTIPTPIANGTLTITNPDLDLVSIPIEQTTVVPAVTHGPSVRVIKYSYTPTRDDEMAVELGDEVSILTQYDDGWAMCKKLSTDAQGMVPVACWEDDDGSESDYEEEQVNHSKRLNKMLTRGSSLRRL